MTDRKTFTIPDGHIAVRDSDGRATGETAPAPTELQLAAAVLSSAKRIQHFGYKNNRLCCRFCNENGHENHKPDCVAIIAYAALRQAASVERADDPCPKCNGEGFINRHANLPDEPCPVCSVERAEVAGGAVTALEAYDAARLCHYGTADHMRLLSRADGLLRAALASPPRSEGVQASEVQTGEAQREKLIDVLWDMLCPGMRQSEVDREYYGRAVDAVLRNSAILGAAQAPIDLSGKGPNDCSEVMLLQARQKGQEQWTNIYAAQLGQFVGYGCEVRALTVPSAEGKTHE